MPQKPPNSRLQRRLKELGLFGLGVPTTREDAHLVALAAQVSALEGIENAATLLASELPDLLEELTDVLRTMAKVGQE